MKNALQGGTVNYSKFREWLIENPNSTPLTEWLMSDPCPVMLTNDLETPTFYQTLSGVTHLDEQHESQHQPKHLPAQTALLKAKH